MADDLMDANAAASDVADAPADAPVEKSIDDTLNETYAAIVAEPETTEQQRAERARDEAGRFAKADAARPAAANGAAGAAPAAGAPAAAQFVDQGPPAAWKPVAKAEWNKLSPAAKADVYRREQAFFDGIGQYQAKAQIADGLLQTIQPYQSVMAAIGKDIPSALNEVLRTAAVLHVGSPAQKAATLHGLAQAFGVDMSQFAGNTGVADQFRDPIVDQLNSRIAQLEGHLANQQRQAQYSDHQAAAGQIITFQNDPANKYFADVAMQMGQLMNAGLATDIKDAYQKACELNPQVKAALAAERGQADAAKQAAERARRVRDAQRAGSLGVRSSVPPVPVTASKGSWADSIAGYYEQIAGA
jgi:hypothetical protein